MDSGISDMQDIKYRKRRRTWALNFQEAFNKFSVHGKKQTTDISVFQVNLF